MWSKNDKKKKFDATIFHFKGKNETRQLEILRYSQKNCQQDNSICGIRESDRNVHVVDSIKRGRVRYDSCFLKPFFDI